MGALWIVVIILVLLVFYAISIKNSFVTLGNKTDEAFSTMDVYLKKRYDMIPNLVETVKGYAAHEKETLQNVTEARTAVTNAGSDTEARLQAENMLTGTLRTLFAVAESYPDLKANTNFLQLQEQLANIENDLQMARRYYNGTVRNLNNGIQKFPAVLIARSFGFKEATFFQVEEEAKQTPKVSF